MAKKSQSKPGADALPTIVPNRDLMQRMNFLYQASVCLQQSSARGGEEQKPASGELQRLARKHVRTLKGIGNGAVVKIDPSVKRMLCKGCNAVLVPGSTASVRVKTSRPHGKSIRYSCFSCRTVRVIPAPPTLTGSNDDAEHMVQAPQEQVHAGPAQLNLSDEGQTPTLSAPRSKRRRCKARAVPLFARVDAGHVVYRGGERVGGDD